MFRRVGAPVALSRAAWGEENKEGPRSRAVES